jgi:cystathionine beta-lyase family protein involved in aluminum resistance
MLSALDNPELHARFCRVDKTSLENTQRVSDAFRKHRVSDACFAGTTGYGYDDRGRETLDKIYADVFGAETALVRQQFVNGTHAITAALFGALRSGDVLLSATGAPYDTLQSAIGISGDYPGSLREWGVEYREVSLLSDGTPDYAAIREAASDKKVAAVMAQRSRGYSTRTALDIATLGKIADTVHSANKNAAVIVDNCYGEFTETLEPTHVGADLIAGSLIKNPGGGLAPTGGYIAGRTELVERASYRLTSPGIGGECGATFGNNRLLFQGFYTAPHVTAQAIKIAIFAAWLLEHLGYDVSPKWNDSRSDIIQAVNLRSPELVRRFCAGIQRGAPVDSFVTPEPWDMPGYDCPVIMAAGAFIQGASIELSADAPMREPYTVYLQGGLTLESGALGIISAIDAMTQPQ